MSRQTERAEFRKAMKRGERMAKHRKRQKAKAALKERKGFDPRTVEKRS